MLFKTGFAASTSLVFSSTINVEDVLNSLFV